MPSYDFRCKSCKHTFTLQFGSYAEVEKSSPACPQCGSNDLSRLIRRITILTSDEARIERLSDPARLSNLDYDDPRTIGRTMREMATEIGEDFEAELGEVVDRLESGESLDSIEESLPPPGSPSDSQDQNDD